MHHVSYSARKPKYPNLIGLTKLHKAILIKSGTIELISLVAINEYCNLTKYILILVFIML